MSVENTNPAPQEEEIQIEITEDAPEGQQSDGDELERYTKSVSKRINKLNACLLYTSPSPRDRTRSRMPSSA